jgi:1-acyl-sn-glycerol-3-phosphate acyltransferase
MDEHLLKDQRFWPIFWTQFLGALNDNLYKNALVILITIKAYTLAGTSTSQLVAICGGLFILPFFLFSATAGQIADKIAKSRLVVWIKVWEILVMLIGAYGFMTQNFELLLAILFLMGLQSTFFGPVKYSILPQLLHPDELVSGNAYVEMGTFIAILLGTIIGGVLIALPDAGPSLVSVTIISLAILGTLSSLKTKRLHPSNPGLRISLNPITPTIQVMRITTKVRSIFLSILGISWFWFFGAAVLSVLPIYCKDYLNGDETLITLFLAIFSIGVGAGSILCGRLSHRMLELGLVPFGSLGMSLFAFDLFLAGKPASLAMNITGPISILEFLSTVGGWRIMIDLLFVAVFGGLFIVPLYTLIQQRSDEEERSRVIAGNNIFGALFMVVASLMLVFLFSLDFTVPQIFLLLSLMNILVAVYIYTLIPEFMLRFLCWILAHVMYRLKIFGRENIPLEGPAILVCNHVSLVDWLFIASASPRPVRFVMHYEFLKTPFAGKIFRDARVIPIAGIKENLGILKSALQQISQELKKGEIVCIFPEGRLTEDGRLNPFRAGIERIVKNDPVPVIPMALRGVWGSFFSKAYGKPMTKPFRRFWSRVSLAVGEPLPPEEVSPEKLERIVGDLLNGEAGNLSIQTDP